MLKKLPNLQIGIMLDMAHHIQQKALMERTRKLFELVCQTYYTVSSKCMEANMHRISFPLA